MGWTELIFNHITLRLPSQAAEPTRYLINPFGLHYAEVTPENLVAVDLQGRCDDPQAQINRAGFVIHSAIHAARDDAHCIMHVHTTAGCAVACKEEGLRHDNFYSAMLYGDVAYHDYEGVTTTLDEQPKSNSPAMQVKARIDALMRPFSSACRKRGSQDAKRFNR